MRDLLPDAVVPPERGAKILRTAYHEPMGTLFYADQAIEMDDRTLAHLKVAVVTKLRRGESFTLSWTHGDGQPVGRTTIWMHEAIPLRFEFNEPHPPELHREWIEDILRSANTTGGIQLTAENMDTGPVPAVASAGAAS